MLILTRRESEKIIIGDNIEIQVCGIKGSIVRIGIDAPKEMNIVRKEIQGKPLKEKKEKSETVIKYKKSLAGASTCLD